jgi:hypothetical protein
MPSPTGCRFPSRRSKEAQRMAEVIKAVSFMIVFELLFVLSATSLVWVILIIVKDIIELWRKIKE